MPDTSPRRCRIPILVLLLLVGAATASAYTYRFHHYTQATGGPGSAVLGMDQDLQGRLWFATRTGVASYDGTDWDLHGLDRGLPMSATTDVAVDHAGRVWALAKSTPVRVSWLEDGRWRTLPRVQGMTWGYDTLHLELSRDATGATVLAVSSKGGQVAVWSGQRWQPLDLPEPSSVRQMAWVEQTLYLATSQGLYRAVDPFSSPLVTRVGGLPDGEVYAVVDDPVRGVLRLAGPNWLGELKDGVFTREPGTVSLELLSPEEGVAASVDGLGGLYVGDRFDLHYYHPLMGLERLAEGNGLVANGLSDVVVDRGGQVWLASMRGVSKLSTRRFRSLDENDGLLDDEVSAVLQRQDGTLLLGHTGGLTVYGDPMTTIPLSRPDLSWGRAIDLEESPDGILWVAMDKSGLARTGRDGRVRWYGDDQGLPGAVFALVHDREGRLWIGTSAGLFQRTLAGFRRVELMAAEGVEPSVRRLTLASDGAVMVASGRRGVFRVRGDEVDHWLGNDEVGYNSTYGVFEFAPGRFWAATGSGLCELVSGLLLPTSGPGPVIDRAIFSIVEGPRGRVWFGTDAGVYSWDGADVRHFGVADGLIGSETNRDALAVDDQGRLWIGTERGVSVHDDRFVDRRPVELSIWIDALEVNGDLRPLDAAVELPTGTQELVIHYRSPSFADEKRLRFQTLVEGFDTDWSEPETDLARSVRYTNLPPGDYRFRVRALDVEGRTSKEAVSPAIVVHPPIWLRPWFLTLATLLALGLMWLVFSLVQGRRFTRRLAADVEERTAALARSEAAVRAESERLAAVLGSISDGVLAVGADGVVTMGNPAAARLLSRDHVPLGGARLDDLLPGGEAVARSALRSAARSGEEGGPHFELRVSDNGGTPLGLDCAVAPLTDAGTEGGMVIAFRDVTERRRAEMEQIRTQKLESLGVLAGGIAHDFNNLLTVTLGSVSLLELDARHDQGQLIDQIRNATHRAQGLTGQLLTFARGGAPQKKLADLGALLRDASTLALAGTNVSLELDVPDDLWHAEVDPGQLEQVVSNLLINARQAMPGGGRIWVSARNLRRPGSGDDHHVEIRIRDEGPGIAADELERIFEPYYTTKTNGTGLGLAISHSVISRHGGTLSVASESGHGAEFSIRLPASERQAMLTPDPAPRPTRGGGRVLVLDDEPFVRDLLVQMLGRLGYESETVADGTEAIAAFVAAREAGRPFDLLIMDLTIPGGMGGKVTMARLLELDPQVRAIVSSGYSQDPVMADPGRYGFVATLGKPFDSRALEGVLQDVGGEAASAD